MKHAPYTANLSTEAERPPHWSDHAKCRQLSEPALEEWFWPDGQGTSLSQAKVICWGLDGAPCPVRAQCLAWALTLPGTQTDFGVWGGYSPRELRNLRKGLPATKATYACGHPATMENSAAVGYRDSGKYRLGCRMCAEALGLSA